MDLKYVASSSLYNYILKLWSKVAYIFLLFSLCLSSLNMKYLVLIKMDMTRFAMKLFILMISRHVNVGPIKK